MNSVAPTPELLSRRRLWPRFTLRVLLALVTLIAVGLGIWTHRALEQRRIVERINAVGGSVCYEREGPIPPPEQSALIDWLEQKMGRDYFQGIVAAGFHDRKLIHELAKLPQLERLQVFSVEVDDKDIAALRGCPSIEVLNIGVDSENQLTKATDQSLALLAKLPRLRVVHLRGVGISRAGIQAIATSPTIEVLDIGSCAPSVSAADFDEIKRLDRVKSMLAWRIGRNGNDMEVIAKW